MSKAKEADEKFEKLVNRLLRDTSSEVYSENGDKIKEAVEKLVEKLVKEVGYVDSRFKASEIIKVGGFYEGTKVCKPDEFDYLVVIDELSVPGVIEVERVDAMHVQVKLKSALVQERWSEFVQDGYLKNFCRDARQEGGNHTFFSGLLVSLIKQRLDDECAEYNGAAMPFCIQEFDENVLHEFIGDPDLKLIGIFSQQPNTVVHMKWKGTFISVDLSPAVKILGLNRMVCVNQCTHPRLYDELRHHNSFLLVTTAQRMNGHALFKMTFTEVELKLMKNMHILHKRIYTYLKYIHTVCHDHVKYFHYRSRVSSYVLKTACIFQDLMFEGQFHGGLEYLQAVIFHLYNCIHKTFLPSLFAREQNVINFKKFGYVRDLVLTTKGELLTMVKITLALLTKSDDVILNDEVMCRMMKRFWKKYGIVEHKSMHVCTPIKRMRSQCPQVIAVRDPSNLSDVKAKLNKRIKLFNRRKIRFSPY